ncbi:MAG: hypothetical protein C0510_02065 [Erythrobacter sp.]|nr:hypothetical protein [Erythrobacter sp.]
MRTEIGKHSEEPAKVEVPAQALPSPCQSVEFEQQRLTDCVADPARHSIAMALAGADGAPFRSLKTYRDNLGDGAANIAFVMNGGMFDTEGKPVGYYVENGERLKELNRNEGPGNFHMKPNGVFFGSDGKWQVLSADAFFASVSERPQFGTQSGPMLLIDGALHPDISEDGPSRAIRNAVGVDADGKAHFVISATPVSFGLVARYFRDQVKAQNALYLDGTVSALWNPVAKRLDSAVPLGPLIVVSNRENGAP